MLLVSRPSLSNKELKKVREVFKSGWLGFGDNVIFFEKRLQELLGARNVIAVNSGNSALHIALDALQIGKGDEVLVPSLTFCGSIQAITALNAIPVFCEVSPNTLNLDIEDVRKRITRRTKAIMPVHFCGNACDMDSILSFRKEFGINVVEDAAHAFGSSYHGQKIGSIGDITCFSFDPIKNITCGEGGAVATPDDNIADIIRYKRMLGTNLDGWQRSFCKISNGYDVITQGYRYHMNNINAAIGLEQLLKLNKFCQKKRSIVQQYNARFAQINEVIIPKWNLEESFPFAYILLIKNGKRDALRKFLAEKNIQTGIHYIPNHLQPFFALYSKPLPITEKIYQQLITLPLFYEMTKKDVSHVILSVSAFFNRL